MFLYINGFVNGAIKYFFLIYNVSIQYIYMQYAILLVDLLSLPPKYRNRAMYNSEFSQTCPEAKESREGRPSQLCGKCGGWTTS